MSGWTKQSLSTALKAAGVASMAGLVLVLGAGSALADPDPGDPGLVAGPAAAQDPTPFTGMAPFEGSTILSPPRAPSLDAWGAAWSSACIAVDCQGLRGYFWNSIVLCFFSVAISVMTVDDQK